MRATFNWKAILLGALVPVVHAVAMWRWDWLIPHLVGEGLPPLVDFLLPSLLLVVSATLFGLAVSLVQNRWIVYGAAALAGAAPFFFIRANLSAFLGLVAGGLLLCLSVAHIRHEAKSSGIFSVPRLFRAGIPLFFTVASLTAALYYISVVDPDDLAGAIIPRPALDVAIEKIYAPFAERTQGIAIDPEDTVDDTLKAVVAQQLSVEGIEIETITQEEFDRLVALQRESLGRQFNIELQGDKKVTDTIFDNIGFRLADLAGPYKKYFPIASAFVFFLAFKAMTWPLYYLAMLLLYLLIRCMVAVQFIRKEKRTIEVERFTL